MGFVRGEQPWRPIRVRRDKDGTLFVYHEDNDGLM